MNKYQAPVAQVVSFSVIDVIATSTPEKLNTWGEVVEDVNAKQVDLFN